jgi:hypothetical protein
MTKDSPQLIILLASGRTIRSAAKTCGTSERTVQRRMADPDFQKAVSRARVELQNKAVSALVDGSGAAVRTLKKLLRAKSESVRLQAVRTFLEFGLKTAQSADLESRVTALERKRNHERQAGFTN